MESLGSDGVIEKGIVVKRLDGPPPEIKEKRESFAKKKRFGEGSSGPRGRPDRGDRAERGARVETPRGDAVDATPYAGSGEEKSWQKPRAKRDDAGGGEERARTAKRDWEKSGPKSAESLAKPRSDSRGESRGTTGGEDRPEGYRGRPGNPGKSGKPFRKDRDSSDSRPRAQGTGEGYEGKPAHGKPFAGKPKGKNPGKYARKALAEASGDARPDRSDGPAGKPAARPTLKSKKAYKPGKSNFKKKPGKPRSGASDGFSPRKRKTT
jgi:hypothetical protein